MRHQGYLSRVLALAILLWAPSGLLVSLPVHSLKLWHMSLYIAIACLIVLGVETSRHCA
jgi:hypothetical protein